MRENLDGLTPEEIGELALAYLSLLKLMNEALEECETGWGFFTWTGRGYEITGHPPDAVVDAVQAKFEYAKSALGTAPTAPSEPKPWQHDGHPPDAVVDEVRSAL